MAHSLSAKKRIRQNIKRRMRNRSAMGAMKTQIKRFESAAKEGMSIEELEKAYGLSQKKLDRMAAHGTIHKNMAARKKSQLARRLRDAKAKAQAS